MSFFRDHYQQLKLLVSPPDREGLRPAQLGAAYSVVSHFTRSQAPAIVVMPTGSGKTATLMVLPFLLRCNRVLAVAPGEVLRGQLYEDFESLEQLKEIGVLPKDLRKPAVRDVEHRLADADAWLGLKAYDVVVSTPFCASPALKGVATPPPDLFDLIIVDEAHHEPANVWNALLDAMPGVPRVLATATPFRNDSREIRGKIAYHYPIRDAVKDGVFGQMEYIKVDATEDNDVAIACEAARVFEADEAANLKHLLLVRTDNRTRARDLEEIYARHTALKLGRIDSSKSRAVIQSIIADLRAHRLDGVICVDMLAEGVNLPELKIAAIHSPHRSLGVTLQFIGRFARTNRPDVGTAKFIGVETAIKGELDRLYREGAVWQQLVPALIGERIDQEINNRAELERFQEPTIKAEDLDDLSLLSLQPFSHVKVYAVENAVDLNLLPSLPKALPLVYHAAIEDATACFFITRTRVQPRWVTVPIIQEVVHHLFVIYYDAERQLLFVNSSLRSPSTLDQIAKGYTEDAAVPVPMQTLNRVLQSLQNLKFSSIGKRHRNPRISAIAYESLSGRRTQQAITATDGREFYRGHVFCQAEDGDDLISIGYSGNSKIWSNTSSSIPELLDWCAVLAARIATEGDVRTNTPLDYLAMSEPIRAFPKDLIAAEWHRHALSHPISVRYLKDGRVCRTMLLELELVVDRSTISDGQVALIIRNEVHEARILHFANARPWFAAPAGEADCPFSIESGTGEVSLLDYLNDHPLDLYCADFSVISCGTKIPGVGRLAPRLGSNQYVQFPWSERGVDITRECPHPDHPGKSIHECLEVELPTRGNEIVFYDHTNGEIADFICFARSDSRLLIEFYHCKGSDKPFAGDRVEDAFEVCGQVVKSVQWMVGADRLCRQIKKRQSLQLPRFLKGDDLALEELVRQTAAMPTEYRVILVQPGFNSAGLGEDVVSVLAAANDYLQSCNALPLQVYCS